MSQLDQSQRAFCESSEQNVRLLAPAGCGKTVTLLHRCREISRRAGSQPRFLIVTFTKVAAAELTERLAANTEFSSVRDHIRVTTLNAYGWQRIRDHVSNPRLLSSPQDRYFAMRNQLRPVWNGKDAIEAATSGRYGSNAIREIMTIMDNLKSMGFDHTRDTNRDRVQEHLDALRRQGLSWRIEEQFELLTRIKILEPRDQQGVEGPATSVRQFYDRFFIFWREATRRLHEESTFTFEDQKYWTYLDMKSPGPDGKKKPHLTGAARYDHIMVDEFQDINPLDMQLVRVLAERNQASLTIVGDDDQAIFEWRGASPAYILHPEEYLGRRFTDYLLSINYRSPRNIVELSQKLIVCNKNRRAKRITAADGAHDATIEIRKTGSIMKRLELVTEIAQAVEIPGRVAVIGRLRRQLIPYEIYYAADGAPFKTANDLDIFDSKAFDSLIELLDIWKQSSDSIRPAQATDRAVKICDFIKHYPLNKRDRPNLRNHILRGRPRNIMAAVAEIAGYSGPNLSGKTPQQLYDAASSFIKSEDVVDALKEIQKDFIGLRFDHDRADTDVWYSAPPLDQISEIAESKDMDADSLIERFEAASDRLQEYRVLEGSDEDTSGRGEIMERPLHLMTATRAKGKEYDTVILLDTNEGIWPHRSADDQQKLEAERRLFYVAFTRARRKVVMLADDTKALSRFVSEMGIEA